MPTLQVPLSHLLVWPGYLGKAYIVRVRQPSHGNMGLPVSCYQVCTTWYLHLPIIKADTLYGITLYIYLEYMGHR